VRHGVEADDVARAKRRALRASDRRPGEGVDDVEPESERLRVMHRRKHGENADAIGDEVRRVLRPDHALAERRREERLQGVEQARGARGLGDQFHEMHVPRRVEEMHTAEPRAQRGRQRLRQGGDRQPRRIRREHRVWRHVRRDARVQIALPVHPLRDRLDDEIAVLQSSEVLVVVGGLDRSEAVGAGERRGFELAQAVERAARNAAGIAFPRSEIEQHHRDAGVGEMGGDLRAHHTRAQHGSAADE
jgi:hypothetical protein